MDSDTNMDTISDDDTPTVVGSILVLLLTLTHLTIRLIFMMAAQPLTGNESVWLLNKYNSVCEEGEPTEEGISHDKR